jgi:hypothetical protein
MNRCPVYIPMIPQGHMVDLVGASQAGHSGASVEPGNEAGLSGTSDGHSNSNQRRSLNASAQYCQMYMYGYVPVAGFAPQQAQDVQVPPASADPERQTGPSSRDANPSLLQIQLSHLEHYIEVFLSTKNICV